MNRHFSVLIIAILMFAIGGIAGYVHHRHSVDDEVQQQEVAVEAEDAQEQQQVQPADPPPVETKVGKNENFTAALQHAGFNNADASAITTASQRVFNLRQVRAGNRDDHQSLGGRRTPRDQLPHRSRPHVESRPRAGRKILRRNKTRSVQNRSHAPSPVKSTIRSSKPSRRPANRPNSPCASRKFSPTISTSTRTREKATPFAWSSRKRNMPTAKPQATEKSSPPNTTTKARNIRRCYFTTKPAIPAITLPTENRYNDRFFIRRSNSPRPVTSHFSKSRYHPILKFSVRTWARITAPPSELPYKRSAPARVEFAGRKGGEGNMVQIAHSDGYETMYLHLSRMFVHQASTSKSARPSALSAARDYPPGRTWISASCSAANTRISRSWEFLRPIPSRRKNWPEFTLVRQQWLPVLRGEATPQQAADAVSARRLARGIVPDQIGRLVRARSFNRS